MPLTSGFRPASRELWLFWGAALVALLLCLALFVALRLLGGVFQQARAGAIEALLIQSAAIGVIVMGSIQTMRAMIPVRSRFHRHRVATWLGRAPDPDNKQKDFKERMRIAVSNYPPNVGESPKEGVPLNKDEPSKKDESKNEESKKTKPLEKYVKPETTEDQILDELLRLTTAEGSARPEVALAFFDLPLEQLCGQISAGAERAIVDPQSHGPILLRLANAAGEEEVLDLFKAHHQLHANQSPSSPLGNANMDSPSAATKEVNERYLQARARVEERVRRSIDCLQIESGYYWRRRLRGLAVALAAALGLTAALVAHQLLASVPTALATGIIGGFFAMLARDLTAIVERLRRVP